MDATGLCDSMIARIRDTGTDVGWWQQAMRAVPRHAFLPETVWEQRPDSAGLDDLFPFHRTEDPERWMRMAYEDRPILTQVDDGRRTAGSHGGREATSSASQPSVVAEMLLALQLEPGMRVLEIGTGTGYNAALLAHRVGQRYVTSIEIDGELARGSRRTLDASGLTDVTVIHGDGELGWPGGAPYDRVIATAAVLHISPAWVAQTRTHGRIVCPWTTAYYPSGLLDLVVGNDGDAVGRIGAETDFMQVRSQRIPRFDLDLVLSADPPTQSSTTNLAASAVVNQKRHAETAIGLRVPRCESLYRPVDDMSGHLHLIDQWSQSWARIDVVTGPPPYRVVQAGDRRLWDEVEAAHDWWLASGRPDVSDWLFRVGPEGTTITLDPLTPGASCPP